MAHIAFTRSLRFRLIMMFIVIFGLVQVGLSALTLVIGQRHLYRQFDETLLQRCQSIAREMVESQKRMFRPNLGKILASEAQAVYQREFFVQAYDDKGELVERSANLGDYQLPFDLARAMSHAPSPRMDIVAGEAVDTLLGKSQRIRMVTHPTFMPNGRLVFLQVGAALGEVEGAIGRLRLLLLLGVPVGLVAAGVASWFVTGRALWQVRAVTELASQVHPGQLHQRLRPATSNDEIGQMVEHVNGMLARLEAGFASQDRFIHDASHELKTPLSTLLAEAQALKMISATPEQWRPFIASLEQEVKHLGRVVDSLLVLARSNGELDPVAREVASLNDAVELAVDECRGIARHTSVEVRLNLAMPGEDEDNAGQGGQGQGQDSQRGAGDTGDEIDANEPMILGDGGLISAMVSNLVRNAIRFAPTGSTVDVAVQRSGNRATVTVRDKGPGIPPEAIDRIFDRFAQGPSSVPHRGAGLGLAIAVNVARLHGGDITVANLEGGGCAFCVTLPVMSPFNATAPDADADRRPH